MKFFTKWKLKLNVNNCENISFIGHYKDMNEKKIRKEALLAKFKIINQTNR